MRAIHDLLRPRPRYVGAAWLLAFLACGGAAWLAVEAWQQTAQTLTAQAALQRLEARRKPVEPAKPNKTEVELQRRWSALAAERSFNWYPVFLALERAARDDIELLEFLPDKAARRLTLHGEARDSAALTAYLAGLAEQENLQEVYLAHQKNVQRGGLSTIAFEIRAAIIVTSKN